MTYKQLYGDIKTQLGDDASAYCLYLLDRALPELLIDDNEVPADVVEKHNAASKRINGGEPLQYVFGYAPFYDILIDCGPGVLIPRFDTEVLVEEAIKTLPQNAVFADICCGSGCIAAAVLNSRKDTRAVCIDISDTAIKYTNENLKKYGLSDRAELIKFDVFDDWDGLPRFDCILCNPPYITADEMKELPENVKKEPIEALYGGEDGLDFYKRILDASKDRFNGAPHIIFEIGYRQANALRKLTDGKCEIKKDLSENDRVCIYREVL